MKSTKSVLLLVSILVMLSIWGFIAVYRSGYIPNGLDVFIFFLIMSAGIYSFVNHMKQHRDVENGFPVEDELSARIKYKAGYKAFMASMYLWLAIFLFQRFFPDTETMLGTGILLSAVLFMLIKGHLTRHFHEDQD